MVGSSPSPLPERGNLAQENVGKHWNELNEYETDNYIWIDMVSTMSLLHEAFAIALRDALLLSPNDPTGWISGGFLVDLTGEI